MSILIAAVLWFGAATASAAPGDWPMFRGEPCLRGVAAGALPDTLALAWEFHAEAAVTSSPAVAGEHVYFGSDDQHLYAVSRTDGTLAWKYRTEDIIEAPPLVLEGLVYVGSSDGCFYALDAATGDLRWKHQTEDRVLGGANWFRRADGALAVLVGSYDCRLYCFAADDGEVLWTYETDNYVNGTPAVWQDRALFGGCDAGLHQVSLATGKSLGVLELGEGCHVAGSVAVVDDQVFVPHYGNALLAIDWRKEALLWSLPSRQAFFSSPAVSEDLVVIGGRDRHVYALDRATGEVRWKVKTKGQVDASPVICGDKVLVGSGDGRLYLWNKDSGEETWSHELGRALVSSPAVAGGLVVVGCHDGGVYAFAAPPKEADGR